MKNIIIATPFSRNALITRNLKQRLQDHNVLQVTNSEELNVENLEQWKPTWVFFPHWPWRIPEHVHEKYRCVVFHMTDLPYGRGGSPLQNLIVRGHKNTMLSAIKCIAEIDAGPVYRKVPLALDGTAEEILKRAAELMESLIVDLIENDPSPIVQSGDVVEFNRRRPEDGDITALSSLEKVYDFIRMLDGDNYPPAFIETAHLRFEFSQAQLENDRVVARVMITRTVDE